MNIQSKRKSNITNIRKCLESYGAEFRNKSDGSVSQYLYVGDEKIRISDHMSPAFGQNDMDIMLSTNLPIQYVVGVSGSILIYNTFKELRVFLKSWCEIAQCKQLKKDSKLDSAANKKQKKINELNNAIQEKSTTLSRLTSKIEAEAKKLDKFVCSSELIDLINSSSDKKISFTESLKLTDKQRASIGELILSYAVQNNGGVSKKKKKQNDPLKKKVGINLIAD